jgi:penicillin-binding protein 2
LARLSMVGIVCLSLFASLFARLWYLQVIDQSEHVRAAQIHKRTVRVQGPRGRILDVNGKVLVDNQVTRVIGIDRQQIKDETPKQRAALFDRLAATLTIYGIPTKSPAIREKYDDLRYGPLDLVPIVTDLQSRDLEVYLAEHHDQFPGIVVRRKTVRTYPYGKVAAHLLGYVLQINDQELEKKTQQQRELVRSGRVERSQLKPYQGGDEIGKAGVERTYEDDLRGTPSDRTIQVDARGDYVTTLKESDPKQGDDVWLTIDIDLQAYAEQVLTDRVAGLRGTVSKDGKVHNAPQGSVVIIDPRDGQIRAMASYPTYDPADLVNGISSARWAQLNDKAAGQPLFNWALQGTYAPGSTFKLFTATAALDNGFLSPGHNTYNDRGTYTVPGCKGGKCTFRNAGGARHGTIAVSRALTVSSDVFFYWIGDQVWQQRGVYGETAIQDAAALYGIGQPTGVALPGESSGRLPTPQGRKEMHDANPTAFPNGNWYAGDNINMAIGQGDDLVTPLQLANAYATFANGGTRYVPQIVSKVTRPKDVGLPPNDPSNYTVVRKVRPEVAGQVKYGAGAYEQIFTGLKGVTEDGGGTAHQAYMAHKPAFPMAGKTGTAEVAGKADTSAFAAFGPAISPNNPIFPAQWTVAVMIPEAGFGGDVSAPVAFTIMQAVSNGQLPQAVQVRPTTVPAVAASAGGGGGGGPA